MAKNNFFAKPKSSKQHSKISEANKSGNCPKPSSNNFFVKNATNSKKNDDKIAKKPFNKKKWRLQRYSKKYKLQQWEEKKKKVVLREYYKIKKDDAPVNFDVQKIYEEADRVDEIENENNLNCEVTDYTPNVDQQGPPPKMKKYHRNPYDEYQYSKEEKRKRREEIRKRKEERDKALQKYKEEKTQKFKKLNKKTKKGQPVMKYRMQMLLEQIEMTT